MPARKLSARVRIVLAVLNDEVKGDVKAALKRLTSDYSMTWVYMDKRKHLFPRVGPGIQIREMREAYDMRDRHYDIKNIAEGRGVVMVELVESYVRAGKNKRNQVFRTPLVLVLEMKGNKIKTGRHYCDPSLSYMSLSERRVSKAFI